MAEGRICEMGEYWRIAREEGEGCRACITGVFHSAALHTAYMQFPKERRLVSLRSPGWQLLFVLCGIVLYDIIGKAMSGIIASNCIVRDRQALWYFAIESIFS
jgi:hypothetical protein